MYKTYFVPIVQELDFRGSYFYTREGDGKRGGQTEEKKVKGKGKGREVTSWGKEEDGKADEAPTLTENFWLRHRS